MSPLLDRPRTGKSIPIALAFALLAARWFRFGWGGVGGTKLCRGGPSRRPIRLAGWSRASHPPFQPAYLFYILLRLFVSGEGSAVAGGGQTNLSGWSVQPAGPWPPPPQSSWLRP